MGPKAPRSKDSLGWLEANVLLEVKGGFGLPEPAGLQPSYVGETSLENSYQSKLPYCSCSQGKIFSHR